MITKQTLFVLGAGASIPYGFPSGAGLRNSIAFMRTTRPNLYEFLVAIYSNIEATNFVEAFKGSHLNSIDSFLTYRPEFLEIGKHAIAFELCGLEHLVRIDQPIDADDNWYFYFWNVLMRGVNTIEEFRENKIQIATFNYDRSLEVFLYNSLKHTFNLTEEEALEEVDKIGVLHLYGNLGHLGGYSETTRPYVATSDLSQIRMAVSSLKLIPESRNNSAFDTVQGWFDRSETTFLLGFGFDSLNVERLKFSDVFTNRRPDLSKNLIASTYGMKRSESDVGVELLLGQGIGKCSHITSHTQNLETLRNHAGKLR